MPSSLNLYPTGNMRLAHIHNTPGESAGFPIRNILDNNLDTYWKPADTSTHTVDIDLGASLQVDAMIWFLKNYPDINLTAASTRSWSDNGSSWTVISGGVAFYDTGTPIRISTTNLGLTHRYWRFTVESTTSLIQLAGFWCARLYAINQGNEYPEHHAHAFENNVIELAGGRLGIKGVNNLRRRLRGYQYFISGDTNLEKCENAHLNSKGERFPVIVGGAEGATQGNAIVCRFASGEFERGPIDHQLYRPSSMTFREIPYIDAGETY